jgi:hypothetical protein
MHPMCNMTVCGGSQGSGCTKQSIRGWHSKRLTASTNPIDHAFVATYKGAEYHVYVLCEPYTDSDLSRRCRAATNAYVHADVSHRPDMVLITFGLHYYDESSLRGCLDSLAAMDPVILSKVVWVGGTVQHFAGAGATHDPLHNLSSCRKGHAKLAALTLSCVVTLSPSHARAMFPVMVGCARFEWLLSDFG